jgi:hypothetical protein
MKVYVYLPPIVGGGECIKFKNASVRRNPEFPNWIDIVEIPAGQTEIASHNERWKDKILAMVPAGAYIVFER